MAALKVGFLFYRKVFIMAKVIFNEARCKGCELCLSVCPKKILEKADNINTPYDYLTTAVEYLSE